VNRANWPLEKVRAGLRLVLELPAHVPRLKPRKQNKGNPRVKSSGREWAQQQAQQHLVLDLQLLSAQ
jgi:hypothetical protein